MCAELLMALVSNGTEWNNNNNPKKYHTHQHTFRLRNYDISFFFRVSFGAFFHSIVCYVKDSFPSCPLILFKYISEYSRTNDLRSSVVLCIWVL